MKKKKFIVTMGGVVGLAVVTSLSLLLATGSSKPETFDASSTITLSMSENYNPEKKHRPDLNMKEIAKRQIC